MGLINITNHLINFLLPALVVGFLVALASPWVLKRRGPALLMQWLINAMAGSLALAGGLWFFGTDAKMASYMAMVLLIGTSQWVSFKGWRG